MTAYNNKKSVHATAGVGVEDIITITQIWDRVEVKNKSDDELTYTTDNTATTAVPQNGTYSLSAGESAVLIPDAYPSNTIIVRIFSAVGGAYSVAGVRA